ncbi:MAG: ribosome silencing factor [Thiotrichales bacterium]|jgi:ribosome-associated protein|nr:ribosome silencing factor [Thiotrichales bacterium]MBT7150300.1 ribosome silencing factor [Thiotrichales bacterium]MBT7438497.1 ribosome silencing factor [Thiotrichales bacterium]MDC3315337.1 ribosome silencing factor [Candidatus Thioglobus sp.]|tara:strand:- start:1515 stop:1850 length:336 start_codon:yes stop_codon:yes gene_type:complete
MNLIEQIKVVENVIEDLKGENIVTLNVMKQSDDMEAIIISTGRSIQHVRGIANNVSIEAKRLNMPVLGTEGVEFSEWVLVDLGEVIVHIMTEKMREFYKLEKLWSTEEDED